MNTNIRVDHKTVDDFWKMWFASSGAFESMSNSHEVDDTDHEFDHELDDIDCDFNGDFDDYDYGFDDESDDSGHEIDNNDHDPNDDD